MGSVTGLRRAGVHAVPAWQEEEPGWEARDGSSTQEPAPAADGRRARRVGACQSGRQRTGRSGGPREGVARRGRWSAVHRRCSRCWPAVETCGGPATQYGTLERERVLQEVRRAPDRERDGTATWSLTTLQRALREAPDGLPRVSTKTILHTLWDAGYSWQESRTWCQTGTVVRRRKAGPVEVTDPDTTPKKS